MLILNELYVPFYDFYSTPFLISLIYWFFLRANKYLKKKWTNTNFFTELCKLIRDSMVSFYRHFNGIIIEHVPAVAIEINFIPVYFTN